MQSSCEICCEACASNVDKGVRFIEPLFALFAFVLVSTDAYVFFNEVLAEDLREAMTYEWRWCKKCDLPKPTLSHHCSICNRCTLRMDHHCPWMANCIGFFNYKDKFKKMNPTFMHNHFMVFMMFILAFAVFCALGCLLGWQLYMVLSAQGTIDFLNNYYDAIEARQQGRVWRNPYDLGAIENFKETFDAHGRFWWITWCLPSTRKKRGNGYMIVQRQVAYAPRESLDNIA
eukprot:gene5203-18430_t